MTRVLGCRRLRLVWTLVAVMVLFPAAVAGASPQTRFAPEDALAMAATTTPTAPVGTDTQDEADEDGIQGPAELQALITRLEQQLTRLEEQITALQRLVALTSLDLPALVEETTPAVVSIYLVDEYDVVQSEGTGFLVDPDGTIFTNAHVIDEDDLIVKVKLADGTVEVARRVLVDQFLDFAVLDIPGEGYPTLQLAEEKPAVGSLVVVIGNAYGYSNSVTSGIVSGVDRPDPNHTWHYPSLQTDAAINHGNSGGPILNAKGEVVAVATWTELKDETDGLAFGIPAEQVRAALEKYDPERGVVRPWLGIAVQEPYWSRGGLTNDVGLFISDVHPLGAGARAGLKPHDIITHVEGVPVNYLMDLRRELEKYQPGETVTLTLMRWVDRTDDWQSAELKVILGEFSDAVPMLVPYGYNWETDDLF